MSSEPNSQGAINNVNGNVTQNYYNAPTTNNAGQKQSSCPKPPKSPEKFAGRDVEVADLCNRLRDGQTTAITAVDGLGGIGKTTLAKKVANDLFEKKIFRAVLWADVNRNPDLVTILNDWLKFVDPQLTLPVATPQQQASFVKDKLEKAIAASCEDCQPNRTLVVLDDVWDNGLQTVRVLKDACPSEATILLTTRSYKVATNLGAESRQLKKLSGSAAIEMLKLYLDFAEPSQLDELATLLGGHPLAMTLAAKRVLGKRPNFAKALKQQLEQYGNIKAVTVFKDLKLEQGEQRDDNLELVLSFSYAELNENDQQRFRALGVLAHDEPFDSTILKAIWQIEDDSELEDICDRFCQLSLLDRLEQHQEDTDAPEWFSMHPLLQTYARALLHKQPEEYAEVSICYQNFVISEITTQFNELPLEKWGQLTPYLPQVHQVGNNLVKIYEQDNQQDEEFLHRTQHFAININNYLVFRREVKQDECQIKWPEMGLVVSRKLADKHHIGFFLGSIGQRFSDYGRKREALVYLNRALEIERELQDTNSEATTLNNIGSICWSLEEYDEALSYYQQSLVLLREEDVSREAATLNNIGIVYSAMNNNIKALEYLEQALLKEKKVGNIGSQAATLTTLGFVNDKLGNKIKALRYYQQALPLHNQVGNIGGLATNINNIGLLFQNLGDKNKALEYYKQALPLYEQVDDIDGLANTLNNIGSLYRILGNKTEALKCYQQALRYRKQVGNKIGESIVNFNIYVIYIEQEQIEEAIKYLARCVELETQVQHPDLEQDRILLKFWQETVKKNGKKSKTNR